MAAFNDSDGFAESAVFRPHNGTPRTIYPVVNRDIAPDGDEEAMGVKEIMLITVPNSATTGVLSTELNAGKDKIDLAYRVGETARSYILGHPVSIDVASLTFRCK